MNNLPSIDLIINNVKTLVDNCRCVNCDNVNKIRYRYSCGHSVCEECIKINNICGLCIPTLSNTSPVIDNPQSDGVQHASQLLDRFQSSFNIDVYKKQRISEKLKTEKELFPECIQAPIKYYNKRKSSILTERDNKRPSLLPGENITSEKIKMEKSKHHVQRWLYQNENNFPKAKKARLPLSDLSINNSSCVSLCNDKKKPIIGRKRRLNKSVYNPKCKRNKTTSIEKLKCQFHESDIELDDDISITNYSNESKHEDKDRLALLAVLEADAKQNNFTDDSSDVSIDIFENNKSNNFLDVTKYCTKTVVDSTCKPVSTSQYRVPFYKKSKLLDARELCAKHTIQNNVTNMKNVTFTIDSTSFITTINISQATKLNSVGTQTKDIEDVYLNFSPSGKDPLNENFENVNENFHDKENQGSTLNKTTEYIVIESDSDTSDNESCKEVEVKADIHRSCNNEDYIFKPLESHEYENRIIPKIRGNTPASSNSSDKENYDPNRSRITKNSKCKKK